MIYQYLHIGMLRRRKGLSERVLAEQIGICRSSLRTVQAAADSVTLSTIDKAALFFGRDIEVLSVPQEISSDCSTLAVSIGVVRDGFESWKIHFFNMVDEFRRSLDPRLLLLPPTLELDLKLKALLASITVELCFENGCDAPRWARRRYFLDKPWFVSGIEALKASAVLESPLSFRNNNIFVGSNFLSRV